MIPLTPEYVAAYQADRQAEAARHRRARTIQFEGAVFERTEPLHRFDLVQLLKRFAARFGRVETVGSRV